MPSCRVGIPILLSMKTQYKTTKDQGSTESRLTRLSRFVLALAIYASLSPQVCRGDTIVNLDATQLPAGPLVTWPNTGTLPGDFTSAGTVVPAVTNVAGVNTVYFLGGTTGPDGTHYIGPAAPLSVTGSNSRSVEAWIYNPNGQDEETVFGWGRRGGPDGSNVSFNHGNNAAFGAVGHWGAPDIGWNGQITFNNWSYIVYTWDNASRVTRVYRDGVQVNSESNILLNTHAVSTTGSPLQFRVARQNEGNGTASPVGVGEIAIARVRVHDAALSPVTIRGTYFKEACQFVPPGGGPLPCADNDNDGIPNWYEAMFPACLNPDSGSDAALDCDTDGLGNLQEYQNGTLADNADTDADGVNDGAEVNRQVGGTPAPTSPVNPDTDADSLTDLAESGTGVYNSPTDTGSDPLKRDTDGDGISDPVEVRFAPCLNPNISSDALADCDSDGLNNQQELQRGTSPTNPDSDGDTITDGAEVNRMVGGSPAPTNPLNPDTDGDALRDNVETNTGTYTSPTDTGTDPLRTDSDGDTYTDGTEVRRGSNPTDAASLPDLSTPLIKLDATTLTPGPLGTWQNTGLLPGNFVAGGTTPQVTIIQNIPGVTLDGGNPNGGHYTGPGTPEWICGTNSRTIEAWIYNPAAADEETTFSWGRRGGPNGSNMSFNHGLNAAFGAVGHWGGGPDMSWGAPSNVVQGRWTYVAYTYNEFTRVKSAYSEGRLANSETNATPLNTFVLSSLNVPLPFRVGAQNEANGNPTAPLRGSMTIARIRVWEVALSQSALQSKFALEAEEFGQDDRDGDGIPTWYERLYPFLDPTNSADAANDQDSDGLTNLEEYQVNTEPNDPDTDDDGLTDTAEVRRTVNGNPAPTNPRRADTDQDGLRDNVETGTGTYVSASDTGSDPLLADTDADGFADGQEAVHREVNNDGSDPNNGSITPDFEFSPPVAIINLDATGLNAGPLATWPNTGALPGDFGAAGAPAVARLDNVNGVTLNGTDDFYSGPITPVYMAGANSRTVEAWIYNPVAAGEENIFAWGRRGGPDGSNCSFNHGTDPTFGAVGHWGAGPDLGWNGNITTGRWTHVAYTFDRASQAVRVYRDGVEANNEIVTNINTHAVNTIGNGLLFRVGCQNEPNGDATPNLRGSMTIARIRVYDEALSAGEIAAQRDADAGFFFRCPVAQSQSVQTDQRTAVSITLSASDPQNDPLTYSIVTPPSHGTLSGTPPNLTYTPSPTDCIGTDSFTFVANDGSPQCDSAVGTVSISVLCNNCPVAGSQAVSVQAGSSVVINLSYSDPDGDPLTVSLTTPPAHGSFDLNSSTYTPDPQYAGADSFTFTVNDGLCSASGTVSITIVAPPVCVARVLPEDCAFADESATYVISLNETDACIVLDGSGSFSPSGSPLQYWWVQDNTNIFATTAITTNCLPLGCHAISLLVSDGTYSCRSDLNICVVTPGEAVSLAIDLVDNADIGRKNKRPLIASLKAAMSSFDRGSHTSGLNQLNAFKNKVRAQISRENPAAAQAFTDSVQRIIDAIHCGAANQGE